MVDGSLQQGKRFADPIPSAPSRSCLTLFPKKKGSTVPSEQMLLEPTFDSDFVSQWESFGGSDDPFAVSEKISQERHLLTPPTPQARNFAARHQLEKQRRRGVYEGEMEPEGVRGEEAKVTPRRHYQKSSSIAKDSAIQSPRDFTQPRVISSPSSTPLHNRCDDDSSADASRSNQQQQHMQFSPITGKAEPLEIPNHQNMSTFSLPYDEKKEAEQEYLVKIRSNSTNSDEDIQQMKRDLVPDDHPSAAAAKAAQAAASIASNNVSVDDLNHRAIQHVQSGNFAKALALFQQVLIIHKQTHGSKHATVASAYHNLGTVHAKRANDFPEDSVPQRQARQMALECFQAAARTARDALGPTHPNVAVSLVRIGFLLLQSKQYQNAIITFREALRIRTASFGPHNPLVANLYNNLGVCHMHLQQFPEGRDYLQGALQIQRQVKKTYVSQLELADTLFNIGGLCLEWIRRQGPDVRRSKLAQDAFYECYEVGETSINLLRAHNCDYLE